MAVARVDADAVFSLLTGAETERAFDRVGRRLTRRLTNGRFETLYPAQSLYCFQKLCHFRCRLLKTKFRFVFSCPFFFTFDLGARPTSENEISFRFLCPFFFRPPRTRAGADLSGNLVLYAIFVL